ncbi:hypothetical protein BB561_002200 [Smittium simulii]|uniref:Aldehyde dehydrogenase n=1 Tax=Smittium simulii TaxID=133385 RepID=A0A2T9YRF5_9FUNG|nr:hypothetical protein BB561_002200 [Smittium simulii]
MALHRMLTENTDTLVDAVYQDLKKSKHETMFTEIQAVDYEIGYHLEHFKAWLEPTKAIAYHQPAYANEQLRVEKCPQGVITAISPWNYPIRLTLLPVVGMIAAGNVVVIKQSELAVRTTATLTRLLRQYMDPRICRVVNGGVAETTVLLEQPVDHICFTGSGQVGKIVALAAAKIHSALTLELGGKCPAIISQIDSADLETVAKRIVWGKFTNCGQTCLAVDYILVEKTIHAELVNKLKLAVKEFFGETSKLSPDFGRIISNNHYDRIHSLLSQTKGAFVLGSLDDCDKSDLFIPPTIIDGLTSDDILFTQELFAPILPILSINSHIDAIQYVNQNPHPLALYCFTSSEKVQSLVSNNTRSGSLVFNDTMIHTGSHSVPFGGVGPSGLGSYVGKASIDNFSHHKTVMIRSISGLTTKLDDLRYPPFAGPNNEWKATIAAKTLHPVWRVFRTGWLSKLWTFVPGWRTLSAMPFILKRLITAK